MGAGEFLMSWSLFRTLDVINTVTVINSGCYASQWIKVSATEKKSDGQR